MAWYNASWSHRAKVTIDSSKVSEDLSNYAIYIDMSDFGSGHDIWSNVKSDGADIRMTKSDGTTELAREIVFIDTTAKTGELHFKAAGTLSGSADTDFYIYFGNSGATEPAQSATYGEHNAWQDYIWVHHMQEAVDALEDSSASEVDDESSSTGTASVAGKLSGYCHEYNGSQSSVFETGVTTNLRPTGDITMEAWFYADATNDRLIMYHGDSTNKGWGIWLYGGSLRVSIGTNSGNVWSNLTLPISGNISTGTWYHVMATRNGSTCKLFLDGVEKDSYVHNTDSIVYQGTQAFIGARASQNKWDGKLDEIRLSDVGREDGWALTSYNNHHSPSTFYTLGAGEQDSAGPTFIPKMQII